MIGIITCSNNTTLFTEVLPGMLVPEGIINSNYYDDDDDVFSDSGPGRHSKIMRWCGLEQVLLFSDPVPTLQNVQPSPRLWVSNTHYIP